MHKNIGFYKEEGMIRLLNGKKVKDLSNNAKHFVQEMFGHLDPEEVVHAELVGDYMKPDFSVTVGEETHYVSMKSGASDVVHQEYIKDFVKYLRDLGVPNRVLRTLLYYHYGDGTIDGTGERRMEYQEIAHRLADEIKNANRVLNEKKEFVLAFIWRAVWKGSKEENLEADYIYHGDEDYGILVSKTQMEKHCKRRSWDYMENLHIGPILMRPHARYVGKAVKRPKSRERIEFYWPRLSSDLDYISSRYDG